MYKELYVLLALPCSFKSQGVQQNSLQKLKGGRKRLNSQAAENVEKRRSVNLNKRETQVYKFFYFHFAIIIDMSKKSVFLLDK